MREAGRLAEADLSRAWPPDGQRRRALDGLLADGRLLAERGRLQLP